MTAPVMYCIPGKIRQVTPKGQNLDVVLAFGQLSFELNITVTTNPGTVLSLKPKTDAYAVLLWRKGVDRNCADRKLITVWYKKENCWVTILRGTDSAERIEEARKQSALSGKPSAAQEEAWKNGFVFPQDYIDKMFEAWKNNAKCITDSCPYMADSICQPNGLWNTIPFGTDCDAMIRNARDSYIHSSEIPAGDHEAWDHGYATFAGYKGVFGGPAACSVFGPVLAAYIYNGSKGNAALFQKSTILAPGSAPEGGGEIWPVTVNLYQEKTKLGTAVVAQPRS